MKSFNVGKYLIRLLDKSNPNEVEEIKRLRYKHLLQVYNENLPDGGLDDDGYDEYSDTVMVIDTNENKICGAYRLATLKTTHGHKFLMEDEYDCTPLKNGDFDFCELSRAFVCKEYQNGVVISLLFLAIYEYCKANNCKYFIGLCSFHGTNPDDYKNGLSLLKRDYSFTDYELKAVRNSYKLDYYNNDEINSDKAKEELPGLLKMYLKFGCKVGFDGSIDYSFNCCDVLLVLDFDKLNKRYLDHFIRMANN